MAQINSRNSAPPVGTSLVLLSQEVYVGERVRFQVVNTSSAAQVISIAVDGDAVASSGIVLYPGGFWSVEKQSDIPITQKKITAIGSAASGTLAMYEEVLQ